MYDTLDHSHERIKTKSYIVRQLFVPSIYTFQTCHHLVFILVARPEICFFTANDTSLSISTIKNLNATNSVGMPSNTFARDVPTPS